MLVNILHNKTGGCPQPIRWACRLTLLATLGLIQNSAHAATDVTHLPIAAVTAKDNPTSEPLSSQALEQLVAPIALYPDNLIALVLQASTDPVGVVLAARGLQEGLQAALPQNPNSQQPQSVDSAQLSASQALDALRHYPDVLAKMNADLSWTRALGEVAALQQGDVLDAIQDYRKTAAGSDFLTSNNYQVVETPENTIVIRPRDAQVIYVPAYHSRQVVVYRTAPRHAMSYHSTPSPAYYRQVHWHDRRYSENRYYRLGKRHYLYNHRPYKHTHYRKKYDRHDNRRRGYLDHNPRNKHRTHQRNDNSRWHHWPRHGHKYSRKNHSGHNSTGERVQNPRQQRHNSHGREQHNGSSQSTRTRTSTASDQTKQRPWKG